MVKRPILLACIGYIIGIIYGLYFKSIAYFFVFFLVLFCIYKIVDKKAKRYIKIIFPMQALLIFFIAVLISYFNLWIQDKKYNEIYNITENLEFTGVVENVEKQSYTNKYILSLKSINNKKYYGEKIILYSKEDLNIGDCVKTKAEYIEPQEDRNYKGFSYKNYLRQEKIVGSIKPVEKITVLKQNQTNLVLNISNNIRKSIIDESNTNLSNNNSGIFIGILLGQKKNISNDIITSFKESSMMHILAVSGAHVGYVIIAFSIILKPLGKRKLTISLIFILVFFMILTNYTPSVVRACIMAIIMLFSKLVYKKSDTYTNISIACLLILFDNPYNILSVGFSLTFLGTIGIVSVNPKLFEYIRKKLNLKGGKILKALIISLSVQIMIFPIIIVNFNMLTFSFIISGIVTIPIFSGIMILGILSFVLFPIRAILFKLIDLLISVLIFISKCISSIPFITLDVITPNIVYVLIYYCIIAVFMLFSNKVLNRIIKSKQRLNKILKKIMIILIIICIIFQLLKFLTPKKLSIYFIDVGQGDSCLIITPSNKTILIDGGGSGDENYDVGKSLLVPYLFNRQVKTIDYMIVSHFDNDHCGGLMYVVKTLNVRNIIISKQVEVSNEFEEFMMYVNNSNANVIFVQAESVINIDKFVQIYILYPFSELEFNDLNNNSIVAKLVCNNFSMLFTGDIEEKAERRILEKYNKDNLKSTVIKVPHHGSKSSSTQEFIKTVSPQIALIGVGENNNFGHPNEEILDRYNNLRC